MPEANKIEQLNESIKVLKNCLKTSKDINEIVSNKDFEKAVDSLRINSPHARFNKDIKKIFENFISSDLLLNFYDNFLILIIQEYSKTSPDFKSNTAILFLRFNCIIWNITDISIEVCSKLMTKKTYSVLFNLLTLKSIFTYENEINRIKTVHSCIGILHNILHNTNTLVRSEYRKRNGVKIMCKFANEKSTEAKHTATAAFMLLTFLLNDNEYEKYDVVSTLVKNKINDLLLYLNDSLFKESLYSNSYGYHTQEVLVALRHLASTDHNKKIMLEHNLLSSIKLCLTKTLEYNSKSNCNQEENQKFAELNLKLLWALSFAHKSLETDKPFKEFYEILNQFNDPAWPNTCRIKAQGILWNINQKDTEYIISQDTLKNNPKTGHIMISYNHRTQELMLKVKSALEKKGYIVWMDVDYKKDSFVDAMAEGIRGASCVLLGLCQAFKNSPHCQQEVKYAYNLRIPFIPLHLEEDFFYEGWLDLVLATILYIPLYGEEMLDVAMESLFERLGNRGKSLDSFDFPIVDSSSCHETCVYSRKYSQETIPIFRKSSQIQEIESQIKFWSSDRVLKWFEDNQLEELSSNFAGFTGSHLYQMMRMNKNALENLCTYLRSEFGLNFVQTLKFLNALTKLQ